jgi:ubiquinone/menaquinone biosynthesis C-methylase UbiE
MLAKEFSGEYGSGRMIKDYFSLVERKINSNCSILDAGCGEEGIFSKSDLNKKSKRKSLIGIDVGEGKNPYVDKKFVGNLENLPFKDNSFDIILLEWVAEHLEYPEKVFKEFSRVLKEKGNLILITPNIRNPLVMFGSLIPTSFKDSLLKRLLKKEEQDLFPLFSRCNSVKTINKIAERTGFKKEFLETYPNPDYFAFSKILLNVTAYIDKILLNFRFLDSSRMYILASYQKVKLSEEVYTK